MKLSAKIYYAIFFILILDFGDVGFNNFVGAILVALYFIPAAICLLFLCWDPDEDKEDKNEDEK